MKSPVSKLSKPFSLTNTDEIDTNLFIDLGDAGRGRRHFVIFYDTGIDYTNMQVLEDTAKSHSSDCVQYLVQTEDERVIGSFFDVNNKKLSLSRSRVSIVDSDLSEIIKTDNESFGGVLVFSDSADSFLIIPENPNVNRYVVL